MISVLTPADYQKMPWSNGQGITEEIARDPALPADFHWRLSRATISAPGPFSLFPGYDRILCVISGGGIRLNNNIKLLPRQVFYFAGEQPMHCELLEGPVQDVGFVFKRGLISAISEVIPLKKDSSHVFHPRKSQSFIYMIEGRLRSENQTAQQGDVLRAQSAFEVKASSDSFLIHWTF